MRPDSPFRGRSAPRPPTCAGLFASRTHGQTRIRLLAVSRAATATPNTGARPKSAAPNAMVVAPEAIVRRGPSVSTRLPATSAEGGRRDDEHGRAGADHRRVSAYRRETRPAPIPG